MPKPIEIMGLSELEKELDKLGTELATKVVFQATAAAARIVMKAARMLAPARATGWEGKEYDHPPGFLKKNINIQRDRKAGKHTARYAIGFRPAAYYGVFVEQGHNIVFGGTLAGGKKRRPTKGVPFTRGRKPRPTTSGQGRLVGYSPPRVFLRSAFDNNVKKVIETMRKKISKGIDKMRLKYLR